MQILIADDESIIRMGLRSMLQELGHSVVMARDGRDALEKARKVRIDLAILDIRMPRTDGLAAAKALVKHKPIPIIFLTAYSQDELIERATDLPVQGYLIKPIKNSAELSATIAIAKKRFDDQQAEIAKREQAERKLAQRVLVERAKANLIAQGMTEDEAYRLIQEQARRKNRPMSTVAQSILKENSL